MQIITFNTFEAFLYDKTEVSSLTQYRVKKINSLTSKQERELDKARSQVSSAELIKWIQNTTENANKENLLVSFDLMFARFNNEIKNLNLSGSFFDNVDFSGCMISNVIFSEKERVSYFNCTCFDEAVIKNSSFAYSKVSNTSFHKAAIEKTDFTNIKTIRYPHVQPILDSNDYVINDYQNDQVLYGEPIDFSYARIQDMRFTSSDLTQGYFVGAEIKNCDFADIKKNAIDFTDSAIINCNI